MLIPQHLEFDQKVMDKALKEEERDLLAPLLIFQQVGGSSEIVMTE